MRTPPERRVEAIIFDFDGLLMDTETTLLRSWQYEWEQWGLELDAADFFADHGGDITQDRYQRLAAAVGDAFDRGLSDSRRIDYRNTLHQSLDLADGLRAWLDEAKGMGLRLAVASSSPMQWLHDHLARAGVRDRFEVMAAGDEVQHHKPAPDVYQVALDRLSLNGSEAVAVEDTAHGVTAAQAAGLRCIAIPNPFVSADRVQHAELVLRSAADQRLSETLAQLN